MYCIDTSALIDCWRAYPPDVFRSLWDHVDELARKGRLFSSVEVLLELKRREDDLYAWARRRAYIFHEVDEQAQRVVASIVDRFPSFVPPDSPDGVWADPYVVALAVVNKCTVVTGEKPAQPNAKRIKIPDVCRELGVAWIELLRLIREQGWYF